MTMLPTSQNKRRALYRALMIAMIAALGALALLSRLSEIPVHGATTALLVAVCGLAMLEFGALDEMGRQTHYIAWYWGSALAVIVIGVLALGLSTDLLPFAPIEAATESILGRANLETSFLAGLILGPLLLTAGFGIWHGVHWLRMR